MNTEDVVKPIVLGGVGAIPRVGGLLKGIVGALWSAVSSPEEKPLGWDEIKARTEKLINQKVDAEVEARLQQRLVGLKAVMDNYLEAVDVADADGNAAHLYSNFVSARDEFDANLPAFAEKNHKRALLTRYTQVANLEIMLLRDAVLHGKEKMGLSDKAHQELVKDLTKAIGRHVDYCRKTYDEAMRANGFDPRERRCALALHLTLSVLDFATIWEALKPGAPEPEGLVLNREVFSPPFQHDKDDELWDADKDGYYPPVTEVMRVVQVHYGRLFTSKQGVDCVAVHYDNGFNTGWMGREHWPKQDWKMDIEPDRPLRYFAPFGTVLKGPIVNYRDEPEPENTEMLFAVPHGHYISSVSVKSRYHDPKHGLVTHDSVDMIWFGFRYDPDFVDDED